jgi:hypothetical protein
MLAIERKSRTEHQKFFPRPSGLPLSHPLRASVNGLLGIPGRGPLFEIMAKIRGKFAPLTEELGWDDRFKIQLKTALDKLMYLLIIHTCHMTRHQAPTDPRYYQLQYGLRARSGAIAASIRRLSVVYPRLKCSNGKLSLLNSITYKPEICLEEEVEEEVEYREAPTSKKEKPLQKFQAPTLEEVREYFKAESHPNPAHEAEKFWSHYESKSWYVGKNKMSKWRAAAKGWMLRSPEYKEIQTAKLREKRRKEDQEKHQRMIAEAAESPVPKMALNDLLKNLGDKMPKVK